MHPSEKKQKVIGLVLCGGESKRLWPMESPKQFTKLAGETTLFQQTVERILPLVDEFGVITNQKYIKNVTTELEEIKENTNYIFAEPEARNTATATFVSLLKLLQNCSLDDIVILLPSDHYIENNAAFQTTVQKSITAAQNSNIGLIGINPTSPNTQFGYIQTDTEHSNNQAEFFPVLQFYEKPTSKKALYYFQQPNYFWNSGIYTFKIKTLLQELSKVQPELLTIYQEAIEAGTSEKNITYFNVDSYKKCPNIALDKLITEKADCCVVTPSTFSWRDLGSWESVEEIQSGPKLYTNLVEGDNVKLENVQNAFVKSNGNFEIKIEGLSNIIVVQTNNGILIKQKNLPIHNQDCESVKT